MKKSEMLEELEQYIRARFKPKSNPAEEAVMLLRRIENLGMMPPSTLVENFIYPDHYVMKNDKGEWIGARKAYTWDPEDELTTIKEG